MTCWSTYNKPLVAIFCGSTVYWFNC